MTSGCAGEVGAGSAAPLLQASFGLWDLGVPGPTPPAPSCPAAGGQDGQGQAGSQQCLQQENGGDAGRQELICGDTTCAIT